MTTPGKNYPALPAFLPTPDSTPETSACRTFSVPDNDDWLGLLMGALNILSQEWAYYPWGTVSAEDTAAKWNDIINQAYADSLTPGACTLVPAPFWDESSGDDSADEAPANDQRWYGKWDGETFLETVSYTFLTGFLATLVGEQAAIKFLTIPRAFRVLIRQNPHGANLLLFLDGGLYKVINGYSPFDKVAEFLIASPGTELMLVVDSTHDPASTPNAHGDFVVDVIRTRLSADDVTNPNVRYYGAPPVFQTTYDGGTTWVNTPSSDVRHAAFAAFPHLTHYTGIECDTAARMAAQLKDAITLMCNVADAAQAVTGLLELILLPTGLVGALLSLFFTICDWIIDNGQATILAAFTDAVYADIKCQLRCFIDADGSITQANLDIAWERIKTAHAGTVATVIDEVRFLFTDVIFTNAGSQRLETGDCSACDGCGWCYTWDFTVSDGGFVARTDIGITVGHYASGAGWQSDVHDDGCSSHQYEYIYLDFGFDVTTCNSVEVWFGAAQAGFSVQFFDQQVGTTIVQRTTLVDGAAGFAKSATMTPVTFSRAGITLNDCSNFSGWNNVKLVLRGTGDLPAFSGGFEC